MDVAKCNHATPCGMLAHSFKWNSRVGKTSVSGQIYSSHSSSAKFLTIGSCSNALFTLLFFSTRLSLSEKESRTRNDQVQAFGVGYADVPSCGSAESGGMTYGAVSSPGILLWAFEGMETRGVVAGGGQNVFV